MTSSNISRDLGYYLGIFKKILYSTILNSKFHSRGLTYPGFMTGGWSFQPPSKLFNVNKDQTS